MGSSNGRSRGHNPAEAMVVTGSSDVPVFEVARIITEDGHDAVELARVLPNGDVGPTFLMTPGTAIALAGVLIVAASRVHRMPPLTELVTAEMEALCRA